MMWDELFRSPLFVAGGVTGLASVCLLVDALLQDRNRINKRLREESQHHHRQKNAQSRLFKDWKASDNPQSAGETTPLLARLEQNVDLFLEQSHTQLTISRLLRLTLWAGCLLAGMGFLVTLQVRWAAICGLTGFILPTACVAHLRRRRMRELQDQLPEAFDLMGRAVQSGQTVAGAFQMVARQSSPPLAEEFAHCCEQQSLGLPYESTLRELARRTGVTELQMFAVAMILQRQSGGNPVDLLKNLAELVRKRTKLAMKVKAITSEGRMQAWVLTTLPCLSLAGIYLLDRSYAQVLLDRPQLLAGLGASMACGILWIRRIVYFEY